MSRSAALVTRWASRLWVLFCLVAVLAQGALRGHGVFRCHIEGTVHLVACCAALGSPEGPTFDDAACCEHDDLDGGAASPAPPPSLPDTISLPAPVEPPRVVVEASALPRQGLPAPHVTIRAGPPPPELSERLALLSRLLC